MAHRRTVFLILIALLIVSPWLDSRGHLLNAQSDEVSDMDLIEKVERLQKQLEQPEVDQRDAAEKELIELGVRVLDYLEPPNDKSTSDAIERLTRVRLALEKIAVASVTKSSKVKLSGIMTVNEALENIQRQTGNNVKIPDQIPEVFSEKEINIEVDGVPFWQALRTVMQQGELVVDTYGSSPGELSLVPTDEARMKAADPNAAPAVKPAQIPVAPNAAAGIFDLEVTRINSSRNLSNPSLSYCNIMVRVRWEPRITPITIDLPAKSLKAIDEFDNPIEITNSESVMSGIVQQEIPELEFSIPMGLVDRQISEIKTLEAQFDAVLPGRTETFRFKKLGNLAAGAKQTKAGATVTFGGIHKNEDLYGITVTLGFDEGNNALESHKSWVYNNPIYLQDEAGAEHQAIAYESFGQSENEITIQYFFDKDPADMTLFYKTSAAIVQVPVKIKLTKIPLP